MNDDPEALRRHLDGATNRSLTPGTVAYSQIIKDPRCKDICTGTDRPAWDSPAAIGKERGTGRKMVYCTCCSRELLTYERVLEMKGTPWYTTNIRPPNLNPALAADQQRYVDVICRYDVVVLWNIVEVDRVVEDPEP